MNNSEFLCQWAQQNISPFDDGNLSLPDTEKILAHLKSCPDCMEELETYYIIKYGLQEQLPSADASQRYRRYVHSFDFHSLAALKVQETSVQLAKIKKRNKFLHRAFLVSDACLFFTFIILIIIRFF